MFQRPPLISARAFRKATRHPSYCTIQAKSIMMTKETSRGKNLLPFRELGESLKVTCKEISFARIANSSFGRR